MPLAGESIAEVLENYLRQSEQVESRLWLAADENAAAGVVLQKLPQDGGASAKPDVDAWDRVGALTATVKSDELLALEPAALAHRLYWQENLQHFEPVAPRFECNCSRSRSGRMLLALGREEVQEILAERGDVEIVCDLLQRPLCVRCGRHRPAVCFERDAEGRRVDAALSGLNRGFVRPPVAG